MFQKLRIIVATAITAAGITAGALVSPQATVTYCAPAATEAVAQDMTIINQMVCMDGNVSDAHMKAVMSYLDANLPYHLQKTLVDNGVKIEIVDRNASSANTPVVHPYVPGAPTATFRARFDGWTSSPACQSKVGKDGFCTVFAATAPVVHALDNNDMPTLMATVMHEIGHALDYLYNGGAIGTRFVYGEKPVLRQASSTPEWETLYKEEYASRHRIGHAMARNDYNSQEAFAETFAMLFTNPDLLVTYSPKSCKYMQEFVVNYK